jgi:cytochrome c-type biogenesis protein
MEAFLHETIPQLLQNISLITFMAVYVAGLLTSISPCTLAIIPVMIGYIGGYGHPSRFKGFFLSLLFKNFLTG